MPSFPFAAATPYLPYLFPPLSHMGSALISPRIISTAAAHSAEMTLGTVSRRIPLELVQRPWSRDRRSFLLFLSFHLSSLSSPFGLLLLSSIPSSVFCLSVVLLFSLHFHLILYISRFIGSVSICPLAVRFSTELYPAHPTRRLPTSSPWVGVFPKWVVERLGRSRPLRCGSSFVPFLPSL